MLSRRVPETAVRIPDLRQIPDSVGCYEEASGKASRTSDESLEATEPKTMHHGIFKRAVFVART